MPRLEGEQMTYGLARTDDPDTSHEAAASISANRVERIVLEAFWKSPGGLIAEEVALITNLPLNTVTKSSSGRNQRVHKWISEA
jgi:hypothetical protein